MATMATTNEDYIFFDFLAKYRWPNATPAKILAYRELVENGDLQIETVLENALANASGGKYKRVAEVARDFTDNSDAKKVTSQFRQNNHKANTYNNRGEERKTNVDTWVNTYSVSNIKNKRGKLRILAYNKYLKEMEFYCIPYQAYKHLTTGSGVLEISLGAWRHESPTIDQLAQTHSGKWAKYKLKSFTELATK